MERVTFLVESTGERIGCLLNPNTLVVRRRAGLRPRETMSGNIAGAGSSDDPLLYTGGGRTELVLELLFDVSVAGSTIETGDVRALTSPLWALAENARDGSGRLQTPIVRFIWGKAWNIPGVIAEVAERLERFLPSGVPQRSWLTMRMLRVEEPETVPTYASDPWSDDARPTVEPSLLESGVDYETLGGPLDDDGPSNEPAATSSGERLDELAFRYYGDPSLWRLLASLNDVDDPLRVPCGTVISIPKLSRGGGE